MHILFIALILSLVYAGLDDLNFKVLVPNFYSSFSKDGIVSYRVAAAIYVLYPLAILYLTLSPSLYETLKKAAALGLTGYGLYHLTNMATLRDRSFATPTTPGAYNCRLEA